MSTCITTKSPKFTHPALLLGLATPPLTPVSPTAGAADFSLARGVAPAKPTVKTVTSPLSPTAGVADTATATPKSSSKTVTSPSTPTSTAAANAAAPTAVTASAPVKFAEPAVNYAMLRSMHVHALRYVIAKLVWERQNNQYIPGQDAYWRSDIMISELEDELQAVLAAQESLDRFPNIFAPTNFPKPHGPLTEEVDFANYKKKVEEERQLNMKMEAQLPWLRQLFIGPKDKYQAADDKRLREQLQHGIDYEIEYLLPTANLEVLHKGIKHPPVPGYKPPPPKKTYEQLRYEKEKAKVAAYLEANPQSGLESLAQPQQQRRGSTTTKAPAPRIGPLTKEEYISTLPKFGPMTKDQSLLPKQREQRHQILDWMRRPWGQWDEQAAELMDQLANLARDRLAEEKKVAKKLEQAKEAKEKEKEKVKEEGKEGDDDEAKKEGKDAAKEEKDKGEKAEGEAKDNGKEGKGEKAKDTAETAKENNVEDKQENKVDPEAEKK
nr:uncharacterized protein CI109_001679 [Kwoniella shandongensis]KAA5529740.1 hypothetical protein CI109_001679 [Kwoniella shandongensis]